VQEAAGSSDMSVHLPDYMASHNKCQQSSLSLPLEPEVCPVEYGRSGGECVYNIKIFLCKFRLSDVCFMSFQMFHIFLVGLACVLLQITCRKADLWIYGQNFNIWHL
jgi:hypothetical protein